MSQWVRLWDDMPNDPKWRVIARRSGRPVPEVIAVFMHMMINAGDWKHWGVLENWDDEDVAASLDTEPEFIKAIRTAMQGKVLDGDRLTGWEKRQTKSADQSAERTAAWRTRKRDEAKRPEGKKDVTVTGCDGVVTGCDGVVTGGDERERPCDAEEKRKEEKRREEKKEEITTVEYGLENCRKRVSTALAKPRVGDTDFEEFWQAWPHRVGKAAAQKAFAKAIKETSLDVMLAAIDRYVVSKPPDRPWVNPATWLNQQRWLDEEGPRVRRSVFDVCRETAAKSESEREAEARKMRDLSKELFGHY